MRSSKGFIYKDFLLRKPKPEDARGFIEICAEPSVMEYYGEPGSGIKTIEQAEKQIEWCNAQFSQHGGRWILVDGSSDSYLGDIGFHNYSEKHRRAEIGYRLKREYWGRGIMGSFVGQLLEYGFGELGYNRVEALVDSRNEGSRRVLEKNRFQFEGRLREYEVDRGSFVDVDMFSILMRDWGK